MKKVILDNQVLKMIVVTLCVIIILVVGSTTYFVVQQYPVMMKSATNLQVKGAATTLLMQAWNVYPRAEWVFCSDGEVINDTLVVTNGFFAETYNSSYKHVAFKTCKSTVNIHPHFNKNPNPSRSDIYTFGSESLTKFMCVMYDPRILACYDTSNLDVPLQVILR